VNPDADLDQLLEAANADLLARIVAAADPAMLLTGLIARDAAITATGKDTDQMPAALAIGMRSNGHRLTDRLDRAIMFAGHLGGTLAAARALTRYLAVGFARALESDLGLARTCAVSPDLAADVACGIARGTDRALDFARVVDLSLGRALDLIRDLARDLARQRGLGFFDEPGVFDEDFGDPDQTRELARDLHRVRELAGELAQTRDRARTCAYDCGLDFGLARDLDEFVLRAADLAADLAGHLSLYLDRARALTRDLGTQKVDASGADLSHADIHGVEVLGGVIWTVQTAWPPGMAAGIRSQSREIRPGVYQVIQGNHPDRAALVPA
jgi:hypothetical protein